MLSGLCAAFSFKENLAGKEVPSGNDKGSKDFGNHIKKMPDIDENA